MMAAAAAAAAAGTILDAMVDGVIVVGINGNITQCTKAFADMFGYRSPQEAVGDNITELMIKSDIEKAFAAMKKTFATGLPTRNIEIRAITKQKKEFPILLNGTALKDPHGKTVGLLGVMRDITELKRVEEELKARLEELEKFTKVAVDREERMVELKKKIKELEAELGRYKKKT